MDTDSLFQGYFYGVVPGFPNPSQSQQDFTSPAHPWTPSVASSSRLPTAPPPFPCLTRVCLSAYSVNLIFTASTSSHLPCSPGPAHTSCSLCLLLYSTQVVHMVVRLLGCRHSTSLTRENTLLCFHYCLLAHLLPAPILPPTRVPPCVLLLLPQAYALAVRSPKHFASSSVSDATSCQISFLSPQDSRLHNQTLPRFSIYCFTEPQMPGTGGHVPFSPGPSAWGGQPAGPSYWLTKHESLDVPSTDCCQLVATTGGDHLPFFHCFLQGSGHANRPYLACLGWAGVG